MDRELEETFVHAVVSEQLPCAEYFLREHITIGYPVHDPSAHPIVLTVEFVQLECLHCFQTQHGMDQPVREVREHDWRSREMLASTRREVLETFPTSMS